MNTATFNTLKFIKKLESAGLPASQAEAIAEAFKDASSEMEYDRWFRAQVAEGVAEADNPTTQWRTTDEVMADMDAVITKAERAHS